MKGIQGRRLTLLAVVVPVLIRAIPEILAGPYPLGFDTVWVYAPFAKSIQTDGFGTAMLEVVSDRSALLMYVLIGVAAMISNAEPFLITKAIGPLLHAFLVFSVYYFVKFGLRWDDRRCILIILISSLYFVPLRFTWDMYKNTLGYGLLILALTHLKMGTTMRYRWPFFPLAGLSILASELIAVLLGAIAGLLFLREMVRYRKWSLHMLAVGFVSFSVALVYRKLLFPPPPLVSPLAPFQAGTSILYNYVGLSYDVYNYPGLWDVYLGVLLLSVMILLPLSPFAWLGFHRETPMLAWMSALLVGAFSILILPFAALPMWHRWLLMLTLPVMIFAVNGLATLRREIVIAFLATLVVLSVSFMALPPNIALPYYTNHYTLPFVPSSMMQNTVPLDDSVDIMEVSSWLNDMQFDNYVLLAHFSFAGWAKFYSSIPEVFEFRDPAQVNDGNFSPYNHVFLLYWAVDRGWFNPQLLPAGMVEIHTSNNIAVYELSMPFRTPFPSI